MPVTNAKSESRRSPAKDTTDAASNKAPNTPKFLRTL